MTKGSHPNNKILSETTELVDEEEEKKRQSAKIDEIRIQSQSSIINHADTDLENGFADMQRTMTSRRSMYEGIGIYIVCVLQLLFFL